MSTLQTISVQQFGQLVSDGDVDLIDVRTPGEFRSLHASSAENFPLDSLDPNVIVSARKGNADQPIYMICQSGKRGEKACQKFAEQGYTNVVNVEGGTQQWERAGLPVVRGKGVISIERQVRIAAGLIVLIGALLAIFLHPYYAAISAFVGAGLMFAGISDTCGMAMMLAKMPWNQSTTCAT